MSKDVSLPQTTPFAESHRITRTTVANWTRTIHNPNETSLSGKLESNEFGNWCDDELPCALGFAFCIQIPNSKFQVPNTLFQCLTMSIVPKETIEVIAQSIGINNLSHDVALAVAPDVEYRMRQIMQVSLSLFCFLCFSITSVLCVDLFSVQTSGGN